MFFVSKVKMIKLSSLNKFFQFNLLNKSNIKLFTTQESKTNLININEFENLDEYLKKKFISYE